MDLDLDSFFPYGYELLLCVRKIMGIRVRVGSMQEEKQRQRQRERERERQRQRQRERQRQRQTREGPRARFCFEILVTLPFAVMGRQISIVGTVPVALSVSRLAGPRILGNL